jgi:hypothetical protein
MGNQNVSKVLSLIVDAKNASAHLNWSCKPRRALNSSAVICYGVLFRQLRTDRSIGLNVKKNLQIEIGMVRKEY